VGASEPIINISPIHADSTWKVDVNGTRGNLTITSVSSNNIIHGRMTLNTQPSTSIEGVYDNVSQKLTFFRIIPPSHPPSVNQIFTGFLMSSGNEIAGYFEALPNAGGSVQRSIFGWYGIG